VYARNPDLERDAAALAREQARALLVHAVPAVEPAPTLPCDPVVLGSVADAPSQDEVLDPHYDYFDEPDDEKETVKA
jgi:hypothetical protein